MSKTVSLLSALLCTFIWGTTFIAQDTGMDDIGPFTFNAVRFFVGFLAIVPLAFLFEFKKFKLEFKSNIKTFAILSFLIVIFPSSISSIEELKVGNFFNDSVKAFTIKAKGVIFFFSPEYISVSDVLNSSNSVISASSWLVTWGILDQEFIKYFDDNFLTLGKSEKKQVHIDGKFVTRIMLPLSSSYDHRIIDGAEAARFNNELKENLGKNFAYKLAI